MNRHHAPPGHTSFAAPDRLPGALSAHAAAAILAAVGDLTLILAPDGEILDLAIANRELANYGIADWAGRGWADTVTIESKPKVADMLAQAASDPRWRQVNHPTPNGEVPVRYLTMPLGDDGRLVAIGQDLRAAAAAQQRLLQTQQSLERDYVRLRQAETRYRMLFDLGSEPVLVVDAATRRIREANAAADSLFGAKPGALASQPLAGLVAPDAREELVARLGAADDAGFALDLPRGAAVTVTVRRFRQGRDDLLLLRFVPVGATTPGDPRLAEVIEQMPDAFVLADADFQIVTANAAFGDLVEVGAVERVRGTALGEWLGRPGIDLELIAAQLREHGAVRNVASILRGAAGGQEEVELSAVAAGGADARCYGFAIRGVGRRLRAPADPAGEVPRSVEQLTELVGRMSLKDIVRESTDLIERLCIEAALTYTGDNRANAAEVLGLSRQSLYSKLHRYGLGDLGSSE